jgi:putative hydrolase of the HAD superfamily
MPTRPLIAFDADDTLWPNQPHFDAAEAEIHALLARYGSPEELGAAIYAVQRRNLSLFGYGAKAFMLSIIEAAIELSAGAVTTAEIKRVLELGKHLLAFPIEPLSGVADTLAELQRRGHPLMVLTKGDLFDQESKLARSGLGDYFAHIEIVSEKDEATYRRLLARHGVPPAAFVMVGNSLKSDILPVAHLGGRAIHVPYHPTWIHEEVPAEALVGVTFEHAASMAEVLALLS